MVADVVLVLRQFVGQVEHLRADQIAHAAKDGERDAHRQQHRRDDARQPPTLEAPHQRVEQEGKEHRQRQRHEDFLHEIEHGHHDDDQQERNQRGELVGRSSGGRGGNHGSGNETRALYIGVGRAGAGMLLSLGRQRKLPVVIKVLMPLRGIRTLFRRPRRISATCRFAVHPDDHPARHRRRVENRRGPARRVQRDDPAPAAPAP